MATERSYRREATGDVVSDKVSKTRTVQIMRPVRHKKYEQIVKRLTRVMMHDPKNETRAGDRVQMRECRPLSKNKRWVFVKKVKV